MAIETPRLTLLPSTPEQLLVLVERPADFEPQVGFPAARGLREFYVSGEVSLQWLRDLRAASGQDPWRWGFFVVERERRSVIGSAGFKGPPDDAGVVEIAYGIVPDSQGRGYATEAAQALVHFAVETGGARLILAHTLPVPNASTRVLLKCGFQRTADVIDPEDGPVWRWERSEPAADL